MAIYCWYWYLWNRYLLLILVLVKYLSSYLLLIIGINEADRPIYYRYCWRYLLFIKTMFKIIKNVFFLHYITHATWGCIVYQKNISKLISINLWFILKLQSTVFCWFFFYTCYLLLSVIGRSNLHNTMSPHFMMTARRQYLDSTDASCFGFLATGGSEEDWEMNTPDQFIPVEKRWNQQKIIFIFKILFFMENLRTISLFNLYTSTELCHKMSML